MKLTAYLLVLAVIGFNGTLAAKATTQAAQAEYVEEESDSSGSLEEDSEGSSEVDEENEAYDSFFDNVGLVDVSYDSSALYDYSNGVLNNKEPSGPGNFKNRKAEKKYVSKIEQRIQEKVKTIQDKSEFTSAEIDDIFKDEFHNNGDD